MKNKIKSSKKSGGSKLMKDAATLPIEVALLISAALSKGINVPKWLTELKDGGLLPIHDFCTKFISLELIVGIDESPDMKHIYEIATEKSSLLSILNTCTKETKKANQTGKVIDVTYFQKLCKFKLNVNSQLNANEEDVVKKNSESNDKLMSTNETSLDENSICETEISESELSHLEEEVIEESTPEVPILTEQSEILSNNDKHVPVDHTAVIPSDSEINSDHIHVDIPPTVTVTIIKKNKPVSYFDKISKSPIKKRMNKSNDSQDSYVVLNESTSSADRDIYTGSKESSTRTRSQSVTRTTTSYQPITSKDTLSQRSRSISQPRPTRRIQSITNSSSITTTTTTTMSRKSSEIHAYPPGSLMIPSNTIHEMSASPLESIEELERYVENTLRCTVKQADLYHMLQICLGYVDEYTLIPPRGRILTSKPREWYTPKELLYALLQARIRFNELHIVILIKLLKQFKNICERSYQYQKESIQNDKLQQRKQKQLMDIHTKKYSKKKSTSTQENSKRQSTGSNSNMTMPQLPTVSVISDDNKVNAIWLHHYLIYLRCMKESPTQMYSTTLTVVSDIKHSPRSADGEIKPASSSSSSSAVVGIPLSSSSSHGQKQSMNKTPKNVIPSPFVAYETWKQNKQKISKGNPINRKKDFHRILSGLPSMILTKDEIEEMIMKYNIMPIDLLTKEIELRITLWKYNYDGRQDYTHQVNKHIRKWEYINKKKWHKVSVTVQTEELQRIHALLYKAQFETYIISEQKKGVISKESYYKYDIYCKGNAYKNCMSWGTWLSQYLHKQQNNCNQYLQELQKRKQEIRADKQKEIQIAPLTEVMKTVQNTMTTLPSHESAVLRQSLQELKKEVLTSNAVPVPIKDMYDNTIEDIHIKDRMSQDKENNTTSISNDINVPLSKCYFITQKQLETCLSHHNIDITRQSYHDNLRQLFQPSLQAAYEEYKEGRIDQIKINQEQFNQWCEMKNKEKQLSLSQEVKSHESTQADSVMRKSTADKSFRTWIETHNDNKYISKIYGGKAQVLPTSIKDSYVHHDQPWKDIIDITSTKTLNRNNDNNNQKKLNLKVLYNQDLS